MDTIELNSSCDEPNVTTSSTNEVNSFEVRQLMKLLEESKQEEHELRCRLQILERCQKDCEHELELCQQEALEKDRLHEAALREIQEEKFYAIKEVEDKNAELQYQSRVLLEKCEDLEKQLLKRSNEEVNLSQDKIQQEKDALQLELQDTLDALTAATSACKQHTELISILQEEKKELVDRVNHLVNDLEQQREFSEVYRSQLFDQSELCKELQEQLAMMSGELSALKATPDFQTRGNSLFAEVEDKRQELVKQYHNVAAKCNFMKKDYSVKCAEVSKLKKERIVLLGRLDVAKKEAKKHYETYVKSYEVRIEELRKTIKSLKEDVRPVYLNGNDDIIKFADRTFKNSEKEIQRLREEMEWRSVRCFNDAATLLETRGHLSEARSELRKSDLRIKELLEILKKHGIPDIPCAVPDVSPEIKIEKEREVKEKKVTRKKGVSDPFNLLDVKIFQDKNSAVPVVRKQDSFEEEKNTAFSAAGAAATEMRFPELAKSEIESSVVVTEPATKEEASSQSAILKLSSQNPVRSCSTGSLSVSHSSQEQQNDPIIVLEDERFSSRTTTDDLKVSKQDGLTQGSESELRSLASQTKESPKMHSYSAEGTTLEDELRSFDFDTRLDFTISESEDEQRPLSLYSNRNDSKPLCLSEEEFCLSPSRFCANVFTSDDLRVSNSESQSGNSALSSGVLPSKSASTEDQRSVKKEKGVSAAVDSIDLTPETHVFSGSRSVISVESEMMTVTEMERNVEDISPAPNSKFSTPKNAFKLSDGTPSKSVLKNRVLPNVFAKVEELPKNVRFVQSSEKTVDLEKENVLENATETNQNEIKTKRKFRRPPPKKIDIVFMET